MNPVKDADLYREPKVGAFIKSIVDSVIAIDFDARTNNGEGLRNHGTKFRLKADDLQNLYNHHHRKFTD